MSDDVDIVVNLQGFTLILPKISLVTPIARGPTKEYQFGVWTGERTVWFNYPKKEDAEAARSEFTEALADYWASWALTSARQIPP